MNTPEIERVYRTARLARLEIGPEEAERLGPQFARILEHFQVLAALELEDTEDMTGACRAQDVLRADRPRPSLPADELLARAPERRDGFYSVPKTLGGDS